MHNSANNCQLMYLILCVLSCCKKKRIFKNLLSRLSEMFGNKHGVL